MDAYDPETYGEKIIVFRKINANGGGEYKLKSEDGHTISTKKDELQRILMHLNIQPNNPIVILNQDNARAFLKDTDGKNLFKLFMEATQLKSILDKLNECHHIFLKSKSQFEMHTRGLAIQKKELEAKQSHLAELKGLESLRHKVIKLKCERAWLDVGDQEKIKRIKEQDLKKISAKITELVGVIKNKDNLDQEINQKMQQFAGQIQNKQTSLGEINDEIQSIRGKIDEQNQKIIDQKSVLKRIETRKQRLMEDIHTLETSLQERGNAESVQTLRHKNAQALAKLLEQEDEVKSLIETANRDVDMLRQTILKCEEKQDSVKEQRQSIQQKIARLENQYARYSTNQSDPLTAYDPQMPAFVKRVETEFKRGGFSKAPRGPVGRYVKVPDKTWRIAVENVLGGFLTAFCVNTDKDRVKLDQIRTLEFPNMRSFSIITQQFMEETYNTGEHQTPSIIKPNEFVEALNLMEVIHVDDPVVMNCLIDQVAIENVLLCIKDHSASFLTKNRQSVPHNLKKIICVQPFSEYFPAPNYRSYSLDERPCRYIQVDTQEVRNQLKAAIDNEKQFLVPIEQEMKNLRQQHQSTTEANRERSNELRSNELALNEIKSKINEIKNYEYPKEDEEEVLRQELEESKAAFAQLDPTWQTEKENLQKNEETLKGCERTLEILKNKRAKIEKDIQGIQRESDQETNRLYSIASNVNRAKAEQATLTEEARAAQADYNLIQEKLLKLTTDAEKLGDRCAATFERNTYTRKIAELEEKIRQTSNTTISIPELENIVEIKEAEYAKSTATAESFSSTLKLLTDSRMLRYTYLKNLKAYFAFRVRNKFSQVLKVRDMQGNIKFDYKDGKLELEIATRANNTKTNTKALSGGERSYSTIAFLIALWSCCDSPFYFLDEYDVFTDQVNRFVMTKILIHEALQKKDQFAFLTPQDMSSIHAEENITIHKFADPVRGNMSGTQN